MKRFPTLAVISAAVVLMTACYADSEMAAFSEDDHIRLQVGGTTQFIYEPLTCQISTSRAGRTFRVFKDNMSDYVFAEFSEVPEAEGQKLNADLVWTTGNDVLTRKKLTLEVLRIEGERIVLWSSTGRIGLCIQALE